LGGEAMSIFAVLDRQVPQYAKDLVASIADLSGLIARVDRSRSLVGPTRFLIWSIGLFTIGLGLCLRLAPYEIARLVTATSVMAIFAVTMMTLSMLSWRLFGGKLGPLKFLRIYAYIAGTTIVFWIPITVLLVVGTYLLLDVLQILEYRFLILWTEILVILFLIEWWRYPAQHWFRQAQMINSWRWRFGLTFYFVVCAPIIVLLNYMIYYALVRIAGFVKW
jgi:hypothetical protein